VCLSAWHHASTRPWRGNGQTVVGKGSRKPAIKRSGKKKARIKKSICFLYLPQQLRHCRDARQAPIAAKRWGGRQMAERSRGGAGCWDVAFCAQSEAACVIDQPSPDKGGRRGGTCPCLRLYEVPGRLNIWCVSWYHCEDAKYHCPTVNTQPIPWQALEDSSLSVHSPSTQI